MILNKPMLFSRLRNLYVFFIFIFLANESFAQDAFTINGLHTVLLDSTEEYSSVTLPRNDSHLIVNGTLLVYGDLDMSGNKSQFTMGPDAVVIVYGNFIGSNKVDISISSYLIVMGDFTRTSGSDQASIDIDDGNVYIFGVVDGWQDDFASCDDYAGDTTGVAETDCDYGSEDSFEDNISDFPPAIADKLNCFDLVSPGNQVGCTGSSVSFITQVTSDQQFSYQWQQKTPGDTSYTDIDGETTKDLILTNISSDLEGVLYRVRVKAIPDSPGRSVNGCKVTFSKPALIIINELFEWSGAVGNDWNDPLNWLCETLPTQETDVTIPQGLQNYPILDNGAAAKVRNMILEDGSKLEVLNNTLEIYGEISGPGQIDVDSGTLAFKGSTLQLINNTIIQEGTILNLEIDNATQVNNNSNLDILGWLKITRGTFTTSDSVTLVSNNEQTALIDGSGTGTISGSIKMQRYLETASGYKYFGSPFSNSRIGDFGAYVSLGSDFPNVYQYNEGKKDADGNELTGWEAYDVATNAMNPLEGYAFNFGTENLPVYIELEGNVNNGSISRGLNSIHGKYTKGFHLAANPYPSPIDWNKVSAMTTNIDNAVYFFNSTNGEQYEGTYSSYVAGVSSTGESGGVIPSMQGFFIHATNGASSSNLSMDNSVRINDFTQAFYKQKEQDITLARITASFTSSIAEDAIVLYDDHHATEKFDKQKDALKLMNMNTKVPNLYIITEDRLEASIKSLVLSEENNKDQIPIGLNLQQSGAIEFRLKDLKNFSGQTSIYLVDKYRNTVTDLRDEIYQVNLSEGLINDRFYLSFGTGKLQPTEIIIEPFILKSDQGSIGVRMNVHVGEEGTISLSNLNGKILQHYPASANTELSFDQIISTGVYLVTYTSEARTFTKKVIVRK
ncbi:T9SS type A sorting domain-containing protein [Christiangramia marina]|uniref:T9SS type A sorting domain-containing protein n=1 Tax=Christiangramia marina TaxID=409436 RepID=UPI003AA7FBBF